MNSGKARRDREKLLYSQVKYQSLLDTGGTAVCTVDTDGNFSFVNDYFCRMLGYSGEELKGKFLGEFVHSEDLKRLKDEYLKLDPSTNGIASFYAEFRLKTKAGQYLWFGSSPVPLVYKDETIGYQGILVDITARKEAEARLRESEERYRAFFEHSLDAILITSPDGGIYTANPAACRIFGMTASELQAAGRNGVMDKTDTRLQPALEERSRTGHFTGELNFVRKDGTKFTGEITTAFYNDQFGETKTAMIIRDVSERNRIARALEESQQLFQSFMNNSPAIAWMKDEKGQYVYLSQTYEKRFAVSLEEWKGKTDFDVWSPSLADQFRKNDLEVLETEKPIQIVENIPGLDGSTGYLLTIKFPFRDNSGKRYVGGIGVDITRQKMLEAKHQNHFATLKGIIESAHSPIFAVDSRYCYTCFNKSYADFMKSTYGADIEIGKRCLIYYHPARDRAIAQANLDRVLQGAVFTVEDWVEKVPGAGRYFSVSFNPVQDESGDVIGAAVFGHDLTEMRKIMDALQESNQFNSALLEYAPNPIMVTNGDASVKYVNPAFEKLTGFSSTELVGKKPPYPWWPEEKIQQYLSEHPKIYRQGVESCERAQKTKNGELFWVYLTVRSIHYPGEVKYFLTNWMDITEQKKAQDEIQQSHEQLRRFGYYLQEKLEEERKHISTEFHDELGQMLTALKINLAWLAKKLPPQPEILLQKSRDMIKLVDDTNIVVKRISGNLRPPILDDLGIAEALKWLIVQFRGRTGIRCSLKIPENLVINQKRSVDLFRIVQEALTNVARHSEATRVWVNVKIAGKDLIITIRDNGRGITEAEIESSHSYGLLGMQERALMLGGALKIEGIMSKRTIITLKIPVKE